MGTITRYLLSEVLKVFIVSLTAMTGLMILVGVAMEARSQGLDAIAIIRLLPYVLPNALCFAIPGTMLFSVCSVYGRLSANNEIVALKSLGISPLAVVWPTLVLGFCMSLVTVWLNDLAVSWGREGMYRVALQSAERTLYGMLRAHRSYSNNQLSIYVQAVEGDELIRPTLSIRSGSGGTKTMTAQSARLTSHPEKGTLAISATNGEIDEDNVTIVFDDTITQEVPLADVMRRQKNLTSPSNMALNRIPSELELQRNEIAQWERTLATRAGFALLGGHVEQLTSHHWRAEEHHLMSAENLRFRLLTEPWRRWANGFSCLFFVIVGIPLATRMRNADVWTSFALCFIPILIGYYPLLAIGLTGAKSGALPPYAVWFSNLVTMVIGLLLFRRMLKH